MAENTEAEGTPEAKPAPKGKSKKLIFIVAGVVAVAAIAAALFFTGIIGKHKAKAEGEETQGETADPKSLAHPRPTVALKEFVINLADSDQARFLKAVIELEATSPEIATGIEKHQAAIRNALLELLSSKTYAEIRDIKGKAKLRQEIVVRLNEILGTAGVTQVFFTDFIIQ
jgi:flagellar protein FliL